MDQEEDGDDYCRKIYETHWTGKQSEFMEKYGNDGDSTTSGTLSKWLNKKTLRSPKCKQAVNRFMADLEKNGDQLVSFFEISLPTGADQQTIDKQIEELTDKLKLIELKKKALDKERQHTKEQLKPLLDRHSTNQK